MTVLEFWKDTLESPFCPHTKPKGPFPERPCSGLPLGMALIDGDFLLGLCQIRLSVSTGGQGQE